VRSLQPHGPYRLGGWCVGGLFAYEMTRQLRAAGEEVELLVLIDCHAVTGEGEAIDDAVLMSSLVVELSAMLGKALRLPPAELRGLNDEERLARVLLLAREHQVLPPSFAPEQLRRHWEVFRTNVRSVESYRLGRSAVRTLLFCAASQPATAAHLSSALDWDRWIEGALEVREVPGDHYSLLRPPAVQQLAQEIAARLTQPAVALTAR
nr:thioesterase domain-containing protein [Acidobacteriota bacterium]